MIEVTHENLLALYELSNNHNMLFDTKMTDLS